jgi:lysophospholipase L1-like esterase
MADDEMGATHRPHSYNTNSVLNNWGLRNIEDTAEAKPAGALRVYCSGGSTTYCYNLPTEDAWPSLLQKKLRALPGHGHDEVLNAGQICFGVAHEFALARRLVPRLKPDVAILYTGINEGLIADVLAGVDQQDFDALLANKQWGVCAKGLDQARFWKRHSVLVRLWDYQVKKYFEGQGTATYRATEPPPGATSRPAFHPYVMANLEHTLRAYIAFLREQGCRPIVVRFGDSGADDWYLEHGVRAWRERAVAVARAEGVAVCDILAVVAKDQRRAALFIDSGVHVTHEGAALVADELLKTVLEVARTPATR